MFSRARKVLVAPPFPPPVLSRFFSGTYYRITPRNWRPRRRRESLFYDVGRRRGAKRGVRCTLTEPRDVVYVSWCAKGTSYCYQDRYVRLGGRAVAGRFHVSLGGISADSNVRQTRHRDVAGKIAFRGIESNHHPR